MGGSKRMRRQRKPTRHYTDEDPSTFTTKEKDRKPEPEETGEKKRFRRKRSEAVAGLGTTSSLLQSQSTSPMDQDTIISHKVRFNPLFRSIQPRYGTGTCTGNGTSSLLIVNENGNGNGNGNGGDLGIGIPSWIAKPDWKPLEDPDLHATGTGTSTNTNTASTGTSYTCIDADETYLAMGDTDGFVSIFTIRPRMLCIAKLDTSASNREEQQTGLDPKLPPTKKYRLYEKKTHPNQIYRVKIIQTLVVLASRQDLEIVDVVRNTVIYSVNLDSPVHSLDICCKNHQVLVSFAPDTKHDTASPLWLLDMPTDMDTLNSENSNVKHSDVQPHHKSLKLTLGHRCAAIWDKSDSGYLLMVSLVLQPDHSVEQELLRISRSDWEVDQRTFIPNKPAGKSGCHTVEFLSQSPTGYLTLVSSTKGIRMLQTSNFQLLGVFGDSVALHGHSLMFQQCCFVPKPTTQNIIHDMFDYDAKPIHDQDWMSQQAAWIVGVPHAHREPEELRQTLHFWDLCEGKHASHTLVAPTKTEGFNTLLYIQSTGKFVASTQSGSCLVLSPTIQSDFGGTMYPPGYKVINDNVEFIEDEDAMDVLVVAERIPHVDVGTKDAVEGSGSGEADSDDLAEAVKLSLLQQQELRQSDQAEEIDVLHHVEGSATTYIPCHPSPCLRLDTDEGSLFASSDVAAAKTPAFVTSMLQNVSLEHFPQLAQQSSTIQEVKTMTSKLLKPKRTKAATLEALLKSSLNTELRQVMISKQAWAIGRGSKDDKIPLLAKRQRDDSTNTQVDTAPVVSPSAGSTTGDSTQNIVESSEEGVLITPGCEERVTEAVESVLIGREDLEQEKKDAIAALLMSASGELESPAKSGGAAIEHRYNVDRAIPTTTSLDQEEATPPKVAHSVSSQCRACQGRQVVHSCGKRERPVDYDELVKQQEEQKELEEEEKRRQRTEKRRIADAKRREARKKKRIEEEQEEKLRLEEAKYAKDENARQQQEVESRRSYSEDKDTRRADMLLRLQAEQQHVPHSFGNQWPPPAPPSYHNPLDKEQEEKLRMDQADYAREVPARRQQDVKRHPSYAEDKDSRRADMLLRLQAEQQHVPHSFGNQWPPPAPQSYPNPQDKPAAWPQVGGHGGSCHDLGTSHTGAGSRRFGTGRQSYDRSNFDTSDVSHTEGKSSKNDFPVNNWSAYRQPSRIAESYSSRSFGTTDQVQVLHQGLTMTSQQLAPDTRGYTARTSDSTGEERPASHSMARDRNGYSHGSGYPSTIQNQKPNQADEIVPSSFREVRSCTENDFADSQGDKFSTVRSEDLDPAQALISFAAFATVATQAPNQQSGTGHDYNA